MFKKLSITSALALMLGVTGCTKINTSEVGIREDSFGEIQTDVLPQGWHQSVFGDIFTVSTRNIILNINSQPMIAENIPMAAFNLKVNYGIVPSQAANMFIQEKGQHITSEDGELYLLGRYVEYVTSSVLQDVISRYKALEVNSNRTKIEAEIKAAIQQKLKEQDKAKYLLINDINVLKVVPPRSIINSATRIVNSQNELQTKINEVEVAKQEGLRIEILANQADAKYIKLLDAQTNATMADAIKIAAEKGTLKTMIVPRDFTALGSVSGNN